MSCPCSSWQPCCRAPAQGHMGLGLMHLGWLHPGWLHPGCPFGCVTEQGLALPFEARLIPASVQLEHCPWCCPSAPRHRAPEPILTQL